MTFDLNKQNIWKTISYVHTVLPPNSRFLGPGISRELEIVNWKNWVFPSNSRYHYGGYSIGIPWIGRNLNEYESVNLQNSELRGRELGGNTVYSIYSTKITNIIKKPFSYIGYWTPKCLVYSYCTQW